MKNKLVLILIIIFAACGNKSGKKRMEETKGRKPNHLINEVSPYLLQHAYNPVDWYPWGEKAFAKAKREDKPIFLSIGYSTCHWCHVMEEESFEDSLVARLMNETFVSIKVDREERPDIDNVYMEVARILTGRGGWPLTILLTPGKKPFFAATYIPRESRYGRMGMIDLIKKMNELWHSPERSKIENSAEKITSYFKEENSNLAAGELTDTVFKEAFGIFESNYDEANGGFGLPPKFPQPANLIFLIRYWNKTGEKKALEMAEKTLRKMRYGGIFDQIGFGFHRYSTDKFWRLPHFEKMLYDQAALAQAYTEAYQATGKYFYKQVTEEIFVYVFREMTSPEGAFYSAEDADTEGEEGKFYTWRYDVLKKALSPEEFNFLNDIFEIKKEGNFREEATRLSTKRNILYLKYSPERFAEGLNLTTKEFYGKINEIREKLFAVREKRVHPFKDDKTLTSWNALMIASLAKAARAFNKPDYLAAAERAFGFIQTKLFSGGKIFHRYRNGSVSIAANANDFAFLINALLELYEASFKIEYLKRAIEINREFIEHFWDEKNGGFFFTSDESERLLTRTKEFFDGAVPSANSMAYYNLVRLSKLTANKELAGKAVQLSRLYSDLLKANPTAYSQFLTGFALEIGPSSEVIIAGDLKSSSTQKMISELRGFYSPEKVTISVSKKNKEALVKLIPYLESYNIPEGKTVAYVCRNYVCNLPTVNPDLMLDLLGRKKIASHAY